MSETGLVLKNSFHFAVIALKAQCWCFLRSMISLCVMSIYSVTSSRIVFTLSIKKGKPSFSRWMTLGEGRGRPGREARTVTLSRGFIQAACLWTAGRGPRRHGEDDHTRRDRIPVRRQRQPPPDIFNKIIVLV